MSAIVSGEVQYTTPRPFEAPSVYVKLQFVVAPDDNVDMVISDTVLKARTYAYAGLNNTEVVRVEPESAVRRGRKPKVEEPAPLAEPVTQNPFGGDGAEVEMHKGSDTVSGGFGEQTASAAAENVVEVELFEAAGEPEAIEIADVDLMTALNKKAAELGGAMEINNLLSLYVPKGGNPRLIEQAKRQEFLDKVHALTN